MIAIAKAGFWSIIPGFVSDPTSTPRPRILRGRMLALAALLLAALSLLASAQFDPPATYYSPSIGTTGAAVKSALHEVIKGHTVLPYTATSTDT